ncbi:CidA/LrgA family protein [Pontibacterium granulatum]|uniref:CidA/LrgA family protein n=1 Tax=Pontibacterium granulatum TaxID=2036029 RepID=UPI002499EC35|nr:CidA/LrgA family protein [Pontibacterium granulatum]MDI3323659.1 CidA/LrgA family protein [Pontibacterium granulatum]
MVVGFLILIACQLMGEIIVFSLDIPVPGAVVGMVLLLIGLMVRGEVERGLRTSAEGLLSILPLMLVPAGVGLMVHFQLIAAEWVAILVALVLSTFVTLLLVTLLLKWMNARKVKDDASEEMG